jgi:hypothetical protein
VANDIRLSQEKLLRLVSSVGNSATVVYHLLVGWTFAEIQDPSDPSDLRLKHASKKSVIARSAAKLPSERVFHHFQTFVLRHFASSP